MDAAYRSISQEEAIARLVRAEAALGRTEAVLEELRATNQRLELRIADLQRQLAAAKKNSSNSSKPPSSDIVKPKARRRKGGKRKRGGQPGHPMYERPAFGPDQITQRQTHRLSQCPCCHGRVEPAAHSPKVLQKVELHEQTPWEATQHEAEAYYCPHCGKGGWAPLPPEVTRGGMLGPRLLGLIAYMKGLMHASFTTIRKYFRDVLRLPVSRGRLASAVQQVSEALAAVHAEATAQLPRESKLWIDETGHKDNGQRYWTWCLRSPSFTCFHIGASRSSEELFALLGEDFAGVISCDYFSAYRKYMRLCDVRVQFCLAHLIRDLKYLAGLPHQATAAYGRRLLDQLRKMFKLIHQGQGLPDAELRDKLAGHRRRIIAAALADAPASREAQAMARRFRNHGQAYFEFITTPALEPTNNLAEQALRFVVIDRHITQGTRGAAGRRWSERIWTVVATCAQQARSAFAFLNEAACAWVQGAPPPSLLPQPAPS